MAKNAQANAWVEEFLWRGRPPGSGLEPTWHVLLGAIVDDGHGGKAAIIKGPLSPEEAEKLDWPLNRVIEAVNHRTMVEHDRLRGEIDTLARRHHELIEAHQHLRHAVDAANAPTPPRPDREALARLRREAEPA
jgi:hypothetical protein